MGLKSLVMRIGVCSSMVFAEKMLEVKEQLESAGHEVFVSSFINEFLGKTLDEKEELTIRCKHDKDAIKSFWKKMKNCDAILVLNYDRRGIKNYIGGNTLMEIGFAHVLNKKIFLMNPIPKIEYYKSEIEAVKPVIIYGDISKIV